MSFTEKYGLSMPAYFVGDPEVQRLVGRTTRVYHEHREGRLRITKRGRSSIILASDLADYAERLRKGPKTLRPSPNPKAHRSDR